MKIDREYLIGILSLIIGTISLPLWYISYLSTRDADISRKISSALNLLPKCGFDSERTKHLGDTLLRAQKAIDVEGNYDTAASLLNSLSGDLYSCKPTMQANPDLMLITLFVLFLLFGVMTIIRNYKQKRREKLLVSKSKNTIDIQTIKKRFQQSRIVNGIEVIFLTPLVTTVILPILLIGLLPISLLRISEYNQLPFEIWTVIFSVVLIVPSLNAISIYYPMRSPIQLLGKFKEENFIVNYKVMKYAFPIQIAVLLLIFSIIKLHSSKILMLASGELSILFATLLYLIFAVMISVLFFISVQVNSRYRFAMAKANFDLFTKSSNEIQKLKHFVDTLKYYNQYIRQNLKMILNIELLIVKKFLIDDEFKNRLTKAMSDAFDSGGAKPLELFLKELDSEQKNILIKPSIRDEFIVWSPILVGIISVAITIIQIFIRN